MNDNSFCESLLLCFISTKNCSIGKEYRRWIRSCYSSSWRF